MRQPLGLDRHVVRREALCVPSEEVAILRPARSSTSAGPLGRARPPSVRFV